MKIDRKSIRFKVIIPLFVFIVAVMLVLLFALREVTESVLEDYHAFNVEQNASEVRKALETAVAELTTAQLLDTDLVVEAKKKAVIKEISSYWDTKNIRGFIVDAEERVLYSSFGRDALERYLPFAGRSGIFHDDRRFEHVHGYVVEFPLWGWKVVIISEPITLFGFKSKILLLLPLMVGALVVMSASVLMVLQRNFSRPVNRIISDIGEGKEIGETGISELDTVGGAFNEAFEKLRKKTEQCKTLHNIAVSLREDLSTDHLLNRIIDRVSSLINAELSAIAIYDEKGKFKKLLASGMTEELEKGLPEGKGILEFMRLSLTHVRIDDVGAHPAFSGSFPEGHPAVRNLLAYPLFSEEGKPLGALYFGNKPGGFTEEDEMMLKAVAVDTAIALNQSERITDLKMFKQVIHSAFDVIVVTDTAGRIDYVNPAFEAVTGFSRSEAIGQKTNILKSGFHDDAFYKKLWETITAGGVWRGEFINRKKDGEIYHTSAVIFPIRSEEGVSYASIQRDITQERKLYEQLVRAQKMEAIGTLAGGIAHDFNNMLTAVLGYSEMILSDLEEDAPMYKPLSVIKNAAESGADLAKKLLTISRKEKLEARRLSLNDVVRETRELLLRSIPKEIEIKLNLGEELPEASIDATQMQQVILNLAVNARDAMPEGGTLTIETSMVGRENGAANGIPAEGKTGYVRLSVSDSGVGIDKDTQRKIFDPFFTTKDKGKGTGLGLYIVHSIISNHGGYINVYSEPQKGTRFNVYLPTAPKAAVKDEVSETRDLKGSGMVLVIDDEASIREMCSDMLVSLGYKVLQARGGDEGVRTFRSKQDEISLVVLDMIMPRMSGSEVFQAVRTIRPDAKVLLCSGYSDAGFAGIDALLKSGAKGFIQKPFTRQTIGHAIKKALSD